MSKLNLTIISLLTICTLFSQGACLAASQNETEYIPIDEIKPDMDAYCLTVLRGRKIEKFNFKVVDVIRNHRPSRDSILVIGIDQKFKDIGLVEGCSGSPVYINGRLAGALSAGWLYSKDPLYMVTPIKEMHRIAGGRKQTVSGPATMSIDFTKPVTLDAEILAAPAKATETKNYIVTSLSESACKSLAGYFEPFGLVPVAAASGNSKSDTDSSKPSFEPGSAIAVPLVSGDISMAAIGTVTEVLDDKILAFGHSFLGYGPVDLPMATARVHTVVSGMVSSFKLASADSEITGAIYADEATGVAGLVGAKPKLIPFTIQTARASYPDFSPSRNTKNLFNCKLAVNRFYTPLITRSAIIGAALTEGPLPMDHTVKHSVKLTVRDPDDPSLLKEFAFENITSQDSVGAAALQTASLVALLMNNPYKNIEIASLDCKIQTAPENSIAYIETANLSRNKVKAGESIDVFVELAEHMSKKSQYNLEFLIPEDTQPGTYEIIIAGVDEYEQFFRKNSPHKFRHKDMDTLLEALDTVLKIRTDRLYLLSELSPGGITIQNAELADLPKTKAVLLKDNKRTMVTRPYHHYIEKSIPVGKIILNKKVMEITVEK